MNSARYPTRAGHSVAVLMKVYAKCIDGHADDAKRQAAKGFAGF
ncbi:MAG: hypothetical protein M0026_18825 [Nocardiopsaceae bacterium]|nr:hypothetical protein [Nocardiopsaceae bacterium]